VNPSYANTEQAKLNAAILASDEERDRTAEQLRQHSSAGCLALEEFAERLGAVYEARTFGELDTLMADLPRPGLTPPGPTTISRSRRPTRGCWCWW
jgi:hypothetical protein